MRFGWPAGAGEGDEEMAAQHGGVTMTLLRLAALALVGIGASACSSVPGWVDPTTWIGPDVPAEAAAADSAQYPDLSDIPAKPAPASTSDDRKQVADSLAVARNNTQYSAEGLRGGTEAAAPPPGAAAPQEQVASAEESAPASDDEAAPAEEAAPAAEPAAPAAPTSAAVQATPAPAMPPASSNTVPGAQPPVMADSALGFQPSKAPRLDASVAQFVPQPIIARYAQTAAGSARVVGGAAVAGGRGNSDTRSQMASASVTAAPDYGAGSYVSAGGGSPTAVILFSGDMTVLNLAAKEQVRAAVEAYKASGNQGYVRVVGHSSIRGGRMSLERRLELNFEKSQARATAVARELIRGGVPADKVLVNAVGDSQPGAGGAEAGRSAEIFVQS